MPESIRALYVDDEPGLLEVGRLFLEESKDLRVETSPSAIEALSHPTIGNFDVIVSDYQMPGMDGIAFLKAVRQKHGDIPFILFTGRGREEVVIEAINNGADFYLQKGGDPTAQFAELAHKIRQAVNRRTAQEELKAAYEQIAASEEELRGQYEELAAGERRVRESQELLRTFLDSVTDTFSIWNADLNLADMNQVALTYLPAGVKKEDVIGRNLKEFLSGEGEWGSIERYREVIRTGVPFTGTESITEQERGKHWLNVKCFRVGDGLGIMTTDVTREKEAEEKLRAAYEKLSASEEELRQQYGEIAAAQQKLIESREQMAEIADTVPGVVYQSLFRPGGKEEFTFMSNRIQEVFGISAGRENFTERFFAQVDPRDRDALVRSMHEAVSKGMPWEFEGRFMKPSGEMIWFQGLARSVQKGSVLSYNGVLLDITRRKQAEEALRASEEKYRNVIENSPYGIHFYETDPVRGLVFAGANPAADRILGISHDQFVGRTLEEAFPGLLGTDIPDQYRKVAESGVLWQTEQVTYERESIRGAFAVTAFRTAPGSMAAMFVDITARKRMDDELRRSEERLRLFIHQAPAALAMFDTEMRYLAASRRWIADYHIGDRDIVGHSHYEIFSDLPEALKTVHRRGLAGEVISSAEDRFVRKDGTVQWLAWEVQPWYTTGNAIGGIIIYSEDITERKLAEASLKEAGQKLALLNSVTRHDIRNQLIALQGFTQHAMKNEKDPAIAGYLEKVNTNAAMIRGQIEFMKAYQELGADAPLWIRIGDVIRKIHQKEVTCQALCSGIEIFSDPMLEKVFANLFDNAIRHGEHVTEITIRCEIQGDALLVIVEDNGIGIPDDEKEKIFEKGYGKNTGYGLFLVREILSITEITIRETGISGKGARFEIRVPIGKFRTTSS